MFRPLAPSFFLRGLLSAVALPGCDGKLDPIELVPTAEPTHPAVPGVHFVEPYDYHYPDEAFFDSIADTLQLSAALGQTESGAFVYVPDATGELRLDKAELSSEDGLILPVSSLSLGVVTFADRTRSSGGRDPADRLSMAYASGARRGSPSGDFRGFHQDVRERLPIVPLVIAPDAIELSEQAGSADGFIALTASAGARAWGTAGQGTEFWITVSIPPDLAPAETVTHFVGSLRLVTPNAELEVPIDVEVLGFQLDELDAEPRFVGVTDALTHNPPEFRSAIVSDLRAHGCNTLRDDFQNAAEYAELHEAGLSLLINTNPDFPRDEIPAIAELGVRPLFNVGLFEPTPGELATAVEQGQELLSAGAQLESEMTLAVARAATASVPFAAWTYAVTAYELGDLHAAELDEFLALLEAIRVDPTSKEVPLSGHYAEVFNGHVPHQARLMYGLWLAQSNLDFALAYGYAMVDGQNPFTTTSYSGVAFPAELLGDGGIVQRVMLPSLTWEAFRAGIDDLRYVITARRLTAQNPALRQKLDALLEPYGPLYLAGDRVDYRNREGDVRLTRQHLAALILEAL